MSVPEQYAPHMNGPRSDKQSSSKTSKRSSAPGHEYYSSGPSHSRDWQQHASTNHSRSHSEHTGLPHVNGRMNSNPTQFVNQTGAQRDATPNSDQSVSFYDGPSPRSASSSNMTGPPARPENMSTGAAASKASDQYEAQKLIKVSGGGTRSVKKGVKDFNFGKSLGEGSYSTVVLATDRQSLRDFAIKILDKRHIIKEKKVKYVNIEKNTLNRLTDHPGILKLYCTFQDERHLYFVLDLAANGELLTYLRKMTTFDEESTRFYGAQVLDSIDYMHSKGVIHRDLKPENVLLDSKFHVKIADFGTAKLLDLHNHSNDSEKANSFVGTAEYVSPELLTDKSACKASDIWAFGCIIYQLLAGKPPFKASNEYQTFQRIVNLDYSFPMGFPKVARDLVARILVLDPRQRPSIQQIKSHLFFEGISFGPELWRRPAPRIKPRKPESMAAASAATVAFNSSGRQASNNTVFLNSSRGERTHEKSQDPAHDASRSQEKLAERGAPKHPISKSSDGRPSTAADQDERPTSEKEDVTQWETTAAVKATNRSQATSDRSQKSKSPGVEQLPEPRQPEISPDVARPRFSADNWQRLPSTQSSGATPTGQHKSQEDLPADTTDLEGGKDPEFRAPIKPYSQYLPPNWSTDSVLSRTEQVERIFAQRNASNSQVSVNATEHMPSKLTDTSQGQPQTPVTPTDSLANAERKVSRKSPPPQEPQASADSHAPSGSELAWRNILLPNERVVKAGTVQMWSGRVPIDEYRSRRRFSRLFNRKKARTLIVTSLGRGLFVTKDKVGKGTLEGEILMNTSSFSVHLARDNPKVWLVGNDTTTWELEDSVNNSTEWVALMDSIGKAQGAVGLDASEMSEGPRSYENRSKRFSRVMPASYGTK